VREEGKLEVEMVSEANKGKTFANSEEIEGLLCIPSLSSHRSLHGAAPSIISATFTEGLEA
jgi:hypothetical protein